MTALPAFAILNSVELTDISVEAIPRQDQQLDYGIVATRAFGSEDSSQGRPLMCIPRDMILCADSIQQQVRIDRHFAELMGAAGGVVSAS